MVYGMWMMMVLFSVWRQTNFSNFRVDTHTHTSTVASKQLCIRRALAASAWATTAALHTKFDVLCVALNFLFAFRKSAHTLCTRVQTKRHTPPWDTEKMRCVRIEVCTHEGKNGKTNMLTKLRIYILYRLHWLHHIAQRTRYARRMRRKVETKRKLDCVMDNVYVWWVESKKLKREKPTRKCANQIEIHNCIRISLQLATKHAHEIQILWSRIHTKNRTMFL